MEVNIYAWIQRYESIQLDLPQVTTLQWSVNTTTWALSAYLGGLILATNTEICSYNTITNKYEGYKGIKQEMEGNNCPKSEIWRLESKNPPPKKFFWKKLLWFPIFCANPVVWIKRGLFVTATSGLILLSGPELWLFQNHPYLSSFFLTDFQAFSSPALCFYWGRNTPQCRQAPRENLTVGSRKQLPDWVRMSQGRILPSLPKRHFFTRTRR